MTSETPEGKPVKPKKDKKPPPGLVIPPKKPKLTKAERRALQEKQRAAKAAASGKQIQPTPKKHVLAAQKALADSTKEPKKVTAADPSPSNTSSVVQDGLGLFSHLPQYKEIPDPYTSEYTETLHPDVIELGLKYASGEVQGDNERCRSMMQCFLQVLKDYTGPQTDDDFRHHFDHQVLRPSFQFWTVACRPHCVSMGNAFTFLKAAVSSLDREVSLEDAKEELQETIERYLQERLEYADRAIAQHALSKIQDGDILLTFGHTEAIDVLLKKAHEEAIDVYVWVADAREGDGSKLLETLKALGIPCGYIHLNALTYVMQQVTKVFVGASALLVNGSIYGRVGTACVALLAKSQHVPVLVCCETYKISNKVQLESITQNELGNPLDLVSSKDKPSNLKAANLLFDVTPDKFVSGIITELGIIPPTSVAVLLREMNTTNDGLVY